MEKKSIMLGIAKNGSRVFSDIVDPYNENAQKEQRESLQKSIRNQIKEAGLSEMIESFNFDANIIE